MGNTLSGVGSKHKHAVRPGQAAGPPPPQQTKINLPETPGQARPGITARTGDLEETEPQAVFATESLAQALRQLEIYGRDGLPVLSADGRQVAGWVTSTSMLSAMAREISSDATKKPPRPRPPLTGTTTRLRPRLPNRPAPCVATGSSRSPSLTAHQLPEPSSVTSAGRPSCVPVSLLHNRSLRQPSPEEVVSFGDRINLLIRDPLG